MPTDPTAAPTASDLLALRDDRRAESEAKGRRHVAATTIALAEEFEAAGYGSRTALTAAATLLAGRF
jgi:hypothetical protein